MASAQARCKAVISPPNATCFFYHTDCMLAGLMAVARALYRLVKCWNGTSVPHYQKPPQVTHRRDYRRRWLRLLCSTNPEPEDRLCHTWVWHTLERFSGQT